MTWLTDDVNHEGRKDDPPAPAPVRRCRKIRLVRLVRVRKFRLVFWIRFFGVFVRAVGVGRHDDFVDAILIRNFAVLIWIFAILFRNFPVLRPIL